MQVTVAPGTGLVARSGDTLLLTSEDTPAHRRTVDDLLDLCAAPSGGLLRRVAGLIVQSEPDAVPPLGLLTLEGERFVLLLAGAVRAQVGDAQLDGEQALTFLERVLPPDVAEVLLSLPGAASPDPRSRLVEGVVRGDAAGVTFAGVPQQPAPGGSETISGAAFTSIDLFGEEAEEHEAAAPGPPASDREQGTVMVRGVSCSRGHFTDPHREACLRCGVALVPGTATFTAVRPPLGALVGEDAVRVALMTDLVLGRDPAGAAEVEAGRAVAVEIDDPELTVSRVHARVLLDGWEVRVSDAASANGTFVAVGDGPWERLPADEPVTIAPSSRVAFGSYVMTFEGMDQA